MRRNRKYNMYLFIFMLVCSLGIGYAFLRTELQINGTADFLDARWNVYFDNLVVNPDSVELSTGNTAAVISTAKTEVTYAVTLNEPGDFYEFTVDAVNSGTMDAMIDTISSKMGGVEITTLPTYMEYSVTYSDGVGLAPKQYLKAGARETYKVHIGFKKEISASDLTGQVENKTLRFSVTYVQADENAVDRPVPTFAQDTWENVIATLRSGNIAPYEIGDEREIDLGSLGTHIIRIANASTPAECSNTGFSQTACGIVLEFVDLITTHRFNPYVTGNTDSGNGNVGGWPASEIRTYLNNDIYNAFPTIVKNAIIDTTVVSGHGWKSGETNFTSTDKIYLLGTHEIWIDVDENTSDGPDYFDTAYNDTRQLDYYADLNTTTSSFAGVIKNNSSNVPAPWWLRSARYSNTNTVSGADTNGRWYDLNANNVIGVSPAFRIG